MPDDRKIIGHFFCAAMRGSARLCGLQFARPRGVPDYALANAYTLITPLYDLAPGHGNLLFRAGDGQAG
ncbi:MAG: hypothetical protein JNM76_05585 [Betaproteobacteria bacterium]|nr:hypothetical protein [Betaproteobacteria bacterium]